jgi:hypothetical protein
MKIKALHGSSYCDFAGIIEFCDGVNVAQWVSIGYWRNGKLHNENGPALAYANGIKSWYLNHKQYDETQWKTKVEKLKSASSLK